MKILTLSTHDTQCGIATYNHSLMRELKAKGATVAVHPIDSSYLLADSEEEMLSFISCFIQRAKSFDAIVIQHEYGLLHGRFSLKVGQEMFSRLIDGIAALRKPTVVIFHSEPIALPIKKFFQERSSFKFELKGDLTVPHVSSPRFTEGTEGVSIWNMDYWIIRFGRLNILFRKPIYYPWQATAG